MTAARDYLTSIGVEEATAEHRLLHKSRLWRGRQSGSPDILVSAAYNVRYHIEAAWPPLQVYATTGKNWQASLIRHILFPPSQSSEPGLCATDDGSLPTTVEQTDAALPFLSFAAGLMAAAEVAKLRLPLPAAYRRASSSSSSPPTPEREATADTARPRLRAHRVPFRDRRRLRRFPRPPEAPGS